MTLATHLPVAVIGAGLSGLSCAHRLLAAGHTVHVLDKSRGPAGRMSTRRAEDVSGPWQCDHGAQYFTARDPAFRAEVARWEAAGAAARWDARLASFDGASWSTPQTPLERFVGTPRMTAPAGWLASGLGDRGSLQLQTTVQQLERTAGGWVIDSAEHGRHAPTYGAVVLAIPAPQAAPLTSAVAPAAAAVARSARMRGSWAVMLRFAAPVPLAWDGAFINAGPLRWVARDSSKPGREGQETWLLHASPEWSEAHIEDDAAAVTQTLVEAFVALGGPSPAAATAHRWRYADTEPPLTIGCWWDDDARLGLCGDWLHGGKVEGAWLSGQAVAARLLATAG
ncbi:MAG: FAD-dependent oxidoreductase [Acidovorax sp.]|jgi:predicted NAD/FAD-dependent oxidoreductase|uniref:NAD(P)/FAD-dependent oxidoreductase n=1 Tax=Acidovorax sp. TaxID=1872122 RepID=UPI000ACA590E|nr:FAD-dependent oxidoreductase [Acidovorax sp.]MDH4426814.1 FAD-dependent oxidoreductase [Acidovorax sp.]MDH4465088.1 FAD-dependent oxidoreductase [Acidovorax sp.]